MNIVCIGGGPAGLYFALLMKQHNPAHEITVVERNKPYDTFGWGVVFSDQTLGHLAGADSFSDFHDAYLDMGYFLTGALLMTGIALPIVLAHTGIITGTAAVLTLCGGLLVYGTSTCTPTDARSDGLCRLLSYPGRVR